MGVPANHEKVEERKVPCYTENLLFSRPTQGASG